LALKDRDQYSEIILLNLYPEAALILFLWSLSVDTILFSSYKILLRFPDLKIIVKGGCE